MPESSFKVAECFKKETLAQVFHCRFHKMFKKCFVQPLQRFASEIAKFQATSSLFIKESVVFNCLSIKKYQNLVFSYHSTQTHFWLQRYSRKKKQIGGIQDMEFEGVLEKASRNARIN